MSADKEKVGRKGGKNLDRGPSHMRDDNNNKLTNQISICTLNLCTLGKKKKKKKISTTWRSSSFFFFYEWKISLEHIIKRVCNRETPVTKAENQDRVYINTTKNIRTKRPTSQEIGRSSSFSSIVLNFFIILNIVCTSLTVISLH